MRFAVFDETNDGETRVALVPDAVKMLLNKQHAVSVQSGAGRAASIPDAQFAAAGAQLAADPAQLARDADCLLRVGAVTREQAAGFPEGKALIGFLAPLRNAGQAAPPPGAAPLDRLQPRRHSRHLRAQSMDTFSSIGHHRRLQGRPAGGGGPAQVPAHAHDRGGHHPSLPSLDSGRRRGRSASHRRAAHGRRRRGLRRSAPRSRSRSRAWAPLLSKSPTRRISKARAVTPRKFPRKPWPASGNSSMSAPKSPTSSSAPPRSPANRPPPLHRRNGCRHEARLGHRGLRQKAAAIAN